jgi:hypothetical protein
MSIFRPMMNMLGGYSHVHTCSTTDLPLKTIMVSAPTSIMHLVLTCTRIDGYRFGMTTPSNYVESSLIIPTDRWFRKLLVTFKNVSSLPLNTFHSQIPKHSRTRLYLACEPCPCSNSSLGLTHGRIGSRGYHYFLLFQCFINRASRPSLGLSNSLWEYSQD